MENRSHFWLIGDLEFGVGYADVAGTNFFRNSFWIFNFPHKTDEKHFGECSRFWRKCGNTIDFAIIRGRFFRIHGLFQKPDHFPTLFAIGNHKISFSFLGHWFHEFAPIEKPRVVQRLLHIPQG